MKELSRLAKMNGVHPKTSSKYFRSFIEGKTMFRFFLLILILCNYTRVVAQFSDSVHHHVRLDATGIINTTGEGSSYLLNNAARYSLAKKSIRLNWNGRYIYGRQNERTSNDDYNTSLDFNLYKTPRFYYWGLGVFERSLSLKVESRYQAGFGLAYVVVDKPAVYLNLSNGVLYESSNIVLQDESLEHTSTFRNSFRLLYRFSYKNIAKLEGTHFVQPSFADASDYIFRSHNSLSLKLTTWLSFTTSLIYNRINRNATENLLINYGLTIEKYF